MEIPIDSDRLLSFAVVVKQRGFSNAARVLGKTQSAVSQAVIRLERELGQRLLIRDGRSSRPTEAGQLLFEHAERILAEMSLARDRLSGLPALRSGRLAIGTSDTLAYYVLPPILAEYRERFPGIEVRLDNRPSPATAVEVAEGRVDVGVVTLPLPEDLESERRPVLPRLSVVALAPHPDVVVFPPEHPLARHRVVRARDLAGAPLVLLDRSTGTRAFLDAAFRAANVTPTVAMEMSSVEVLKRLVELGFGVSVVPAISVAREVEGGTLAQRPLAGATGARRIGLVLRSGSPPSRAAQAFAELVVAGIPRGKKGRS
jgi:DNA-binding transcriptional LysR family regulator